MVVLLRIASDWALNVRPTWASRIRHIGVNALKYAQNRREQGALSIRDGSVSVTSVESLENVLKAQVSTHLVLWATVGKSASVSASESY